MWASLPNTTSEFTRFVSRAPRRFRKDDAGSLTVFSLFLLILILLIAGTAVDAMRHEVRRVALQNTLDSAILSAASLNQSIDAETLIKDHIVKAGMNPDKVTVSSNDTFTSGGGDLTARNVTVSAYVDTPTMFMSMMGIDDLESTMGSGAEEAIMNIEISLIVDISGSMGSNQRLDNLKVAAKDFAQHVLTVGPNAERTSISIIPYNATVVAGNSFLARLNAAGVTQAVVPNPVHPGALSAYSTEHNYSSCVRFRDADFNTREISPTTPLERVAHFDRNNNGFNTPAMWRRWCNDDRSDILVFERNLTNINTHIENLQAGGMTGIDNGMKWGVALLDPAIGPVIDAMVADGELDPVMAGRPGIYDAALTKKIVVLMTDGANTVQRDLKDEFKNGPSRIWRTTDPSITSGWDSSLGRNRTAFDGYFVEMPSNPAATRWYVPGLPNTTADDTYMSEADALAITDLEQQDYITIYERFAVRDVADFFFGNSGDTTAYNQHRNAVTNHDTYGQVDTRLQAICDKANENALIEVYAIGFEAPVGGQNAMKGCASVPGNYFDVQGTEISQAFDAIAGQITLLRLTN